jgi:ubiquinone biosynthesis protein COQ4
VGLPRPRRKPLPRVRKIAAMANDITTLDVSQRRDWRGAFAALRRLLGNTGDTEQVFRIMRALNAGSVKVGYERLLSTRDGGRIAYRRVELATLFSKPDYVAGFAPSTVGAAYAAFLDETGYSAEGLAAISQAEDLSREAEHPYAWFGRRTRDIHDIWHILTGYRADEALGEACLVSFSYAQTGGLGWALIGLGGVVKAIRTPGGKPAIRAIWEGYRRGRRAAWLQGEDYERLLAEPLELARGRLGLAPSVHYRRLKSNVGL